jgi:hypothetical protein
MEQRDGFSRPFCVCHACGMKNKFSAVEKENIPKFEGHFLSC